MDDADVGGLVLRAAAGDRSAWDELVSRFSGLVCAVARGHRLRSEDAAEVFQTTWLRLLENLAQLREPDRVGAWLATTARRECLRLFRQHGTERRGDGDPSLLVDLVHVGGQENRHRSPRWDRCARRPDPIPSAPSHHVPAGVLPWGNALDWVAMG